MVLNVPGMIRPINDSVELVRFEQWIAEECGEGEGVTQVDVEHHIGEYSEERKGYTFYLVYFPDAGNIWRVRKNDENGQYRKVSEAYF